MKSKILKLADYKDAQFEKNVDISCPAEYMKKKIMLLTRPKKKTITPEKVENGDTAVLTLNSDLPRFCRPMIPVKVGNYLYDAELEAQLIGREVQKPFTTVVQGHAVTVTVISISRTIYPEPDDNMVAAYVAGETGMEDVKTVADFCRWAENQYREEKLREATYVGIRACFDYVLNHSDWEFDESELRENIRAVLKESAAEKGLDFDTMSDEDFQLVYNVENRQQLERKYRKWAERNVATSLWMAAVHGIDPAQASQAEINKLDRSFLETYVSSQLNLH